MKAFALVLLLSLAEIAASASAREPQTLKERLSDKASDAQRVDNCRVPVERRGAVPRPDCAGKPDPGTPRTETGSSTPLSER